jgi:sugar phosphate isomerase/epimerase
MQRILSTYRYINHPLKRSLLAEISRADIAAIEVFCAPGHFEHRSLQSIADLGDALGEYGLALHALHAPTERDLAPGRQSGAPISICDPERVRRIDAIDEVKRAIEVAERIPFRFLVQHLGHRHQTADPRKLDAAFSSLEHLTVFAKARGVTIALENTPDELGAPESLRDFVRETHLHDLKFCFDIGHAHMEGGVAKGFGAMRERVVTAHVHDNHETKDEHLLPYEGSIDWEASLGALAGAPQPLTLVLELKEQPAGAPSLDQIRIAFDKLEENLDNKGTRSPQS